MRDSVRPGPHTPPRDLLQPLDGHPAVGRRLLGEVRVDAVEPRVESLPFVVGERPLRGEHLRVSPNRLAVDIDPHPAERIPDDLLARHHSDRSGDRAGLRDHGVAGHRDVVPAGGGDGGHRRDHRPTGATELEHLPANRVARRVGPARAVDPEDDGLDRRVTSGGTKRRTERLRAHGRGTQRDRAAATEEDRAGGAHERHHGAVPVEHGAPQRGATPPVASIPVDVAQAHRSQPGAQACVDLVAIPQAVDQSGLARFVRGERRAPDDLLDRRRFEAPGGGHVGGDRLGGRFRESPRHLPAGVGHAAAQEGVRRGLVLVALPELRLHAEAVEGIADEERARDDSGQAEVARRLEPDLRERGRQVIADVRCVQLAEGLGPGHRELPGRAKPQHGVAQLARVGEAERALSDVGDEADDLLVTRRAGQGIDQPADDRDLPSGHPQG